MRPHPDEDTLALHALGEPALTGEDVEHVRGCEACSRTVEELAGTVEVVRGPRSRDLGPVPVPDRIWDGIATALDLPPGTSPRPAQEHEAEPQRGSAAAGSSAGASAGHLVPGQAGPPDRPAEVGDLAIARARPRPWGLLVAAAAGVVVGAAGALLATGLPGGDPAAETAVLAAADLAAFGDFEDTDVHGSARLVAAPAPAVDDDAGLGGRTLLQLELAGLPDTDDDFLEAWLIDADSGAMVSLGPLPRAGADSTTVDLFVPDGLDVSRFDLVDVSSEPPDGDPTHSGASLVRGTFEL